MNDIDVARIRLEELLERMSSPDGGVAATCRLVAAELGRQAKPPRQWSWSYIHQVSHGKLLPSRRLIRSINRLYTKLSDLAVDYELVSVIAPTGLVLPNSLVNISSRNCAYSGCTRMFIPTNPAQKYCPICGKMKRRLRNAS